MRFPPIRQHKFDGLSIISRHLRNISLTTTKIIVYGLRMIRKQPTPKPTESELELLGPLWERGPLTVRELFKAVNEGRPVVYTGVLKLLQIMTEKGVVERDERERAHVYRPAISQEDTERRALCAMS